MPSLDPHYLLARLQALINAPTWADTRRLLEATPELLTDEAAEMEALDALWAPYAADYADPAMQRRAVGQYWEIRRAIARLDRMEDPPFAHPYWWAAFQAVGDVMSNE